MRDFRSAHELKMHGTPMAIIDYVAVHGFRMTESMSYKREEFYVK